MGTSGTDMRDEREGSHGADITADTLQELRSPSSDGVRAPKPPGGGRYRLAAELGHGGMGEVLAARDEQIGREVAVKRLRAREPSERQIHRFMREACIQGRLEHPAIVPVHELGRDASGRPFFAMKKLAGTTLAQILESHDPEKFPRQRLLRAFAEVCLAIELAHTRGVVHRDLKPENIMLGDFGEVYVLDWGVAKLLGDAADGVGEEPPGLDSGELVTVAGVAVGTPGYMSPEQVRGQSDIGPRSDVYALGCVLFEVLTGVTLHPRGAAALQTTVHGIERSPARRAPEREVPPELDALCLAATALSPDDRVATARELGAGVQRFLDGDRDVARRRELASGHLAAATAAFAHDTAAGRATAMREAGRALALDPTLAGAAELVTRLMLEPPRELPPEVEAAVSADQVARRVANARVARWAYVGYAILLPVLAWQTPALDRCVLIAAIAINGAMTWSIRAGRRAPPIFAHVLSNAALLAVISYLFTPVLLAPALAAVTGLVLSLLPPDGPLSRSWGIITAMCLGALAPWIAEALGLLPATMRVDSSGFHLFGTGVLGGGSFTTVALAVTFAVIIGIAVSIGAGIRKGERASRQRLHLQAWQLRQLVP